MRVYLALTITKVKAFAEKFEIRKLPSLGPPRIIECRARVGGDDEDEDGGGGGGAAAAPATADDGGASVPDPRIQSGMEWLTGVVKANHATLQKRVDTAGKVEASRLAALEAERESEVAKIKAVREAAAAK